MDGCLGAIKFGDELLLIATEHRGARARLGGRTYPGLSLLLLLLMPRDRAGNSVSDMKVVSSLSFKRPFTLVALSPFSTWMKKIIVKTTRNVMLVNQEVSVDAWREHDRTTSKRLDLRFFCVRLLCLRKYF
jgi:hypothetical protein